MGFVTKIPSTRKFIQSSRPSKYIDSLKVCRLQSTSTMDLVSLDEKGNRRNGCIFSTLQGGSSDRDFSSMARHRRQNDDMRQWKRLRVAAEKLCKDETFIPLATRAEELDLVQAAEQRDQFCKILLLVNHGEDVSQILGNEQVNDDFVNTDALTGKGIGQALTLSRRTATFCNGETGLIPDLFVLEPTYKATKTAFLSFPYDTPYNSLRRTRWVCHPSAISCSTGKVAKSSELEKEFLGVDCSMLDSHLSDKASISTKGLHQNAEDLIKWLKEREEKIIVGKFSCV